LRLIAAHTFLYTGDAPDSEVAVSTYPVIIGQANGKKVPVVQAYAFTKYLGYLHLEFDDAGNLVEWDGSPILLNKDVPQDDDVVAMLDKYRAGIEELESQVIGVTKVTLDGSCRSVECNLGNFITDGMVNYNALRYSSNDYWTDAAIAFTTGGGIRTSIDRNSNGGNITMEAITSIQPYSSKLVVAELSGNDIVQALEHSVFYYGENRGTFLQMSGVHVVYDVSKAPGERVVGVKVLCAQCTIPVLEDLDENKKYGVVLQDFIANGGDGYEMFVNKTFKDFDVVDNEAFIEYIRKKSPLHPTVEWRITFTESSYASTEVPATTQTASSIRISIVAVLVYASSSLMSFKIVQ